MQNYRRCGVADRRLPVICQTPATSLESPAMTVTRPKTRRLVADGHARFLHIEAD
jgi:hypothetical protein